MEKHRLHESQADVVLGPCPGCQLWQLDYTYEAAGSFLKLNERERLALRQGQHLSDLIVDASAFYDAVEEILSQHLQECPHLQRALFEFD